MMMQDKRRAEELEELGEARAKRDHGALCASVSDFVSFLTLRGRQRWLLLVFHFSQASWTQGETSKTRSITYRNLKNL